jgi:hypothetical protein
VGAKRKKTEREHNGSTYRDDHVARVNVINRGLLGRMMTHARKQKGFVLMFVVGVIFVLGLATLGMFVVLGQQIKYHFKTIDRAMAYYLLESAQTYAQLDFKKPGIFTQFPFTKVYTVQFKGAPIALTYTVYRTDPDTKHVQRGAGTYTIIASVPSPLKLGCIYKLKMKANRGWPFFMSGMPGGG